MIFSIFEVDDFHNLHNFQTLVYNCVWNKIGPYTKTYEPFLSTRFGILLHY